jgi:hypothetical protein
MKVEARAGGTIKLAVHEGLKVERKQIGKFCLFRTSGYLHGRPRPG